MSRLYIFHHVFKTGGTSFNLSYLPGAFAPEEIFVLRGSRGLNEEDLERVMAFSTEQRNRLKVIAGHNTGALRPSYPHARFLSLVRDPVARAISAYLHAKHHKDSWELTGRKIQEENMSLGEFVEANWNDEMYNCQSRLLLGPEWAANAPPDEPEVIAAIRSRFHLIGYTEALELFLFYLYVTEGFPLVLFNNRLVRKERAGFRPTDEDVSVIHRHNELDRVFHTCARNEFDRKVAEVWTDETEQLYRQYLAALELYRQTTEERPGATPVRWFPENLQTNAPLAVNNLSAHD